MNRIGTALTIGLILTIGLATVLPSAARADVDRLRENCREAYDRGDLAASRAAADSALAELPGDYQSSWMLARVLIDIGNREQEKKVRKGIYKMAVDHARAAVAAEPDDTWGHHYLAAAVGKLALTEGGKKKIELSKEVREEAQRALECDPANDKSHHILGRWNREVATLSPVLKLAAKIVYGGVPEGASKEKAEQHFLEAIRLHPEHINHHLELGVTYMSMKRYEDAIEQFAIVAELPERDPNDADYKDEAVLMTTRCEKRIERGQRDRSR